MGLVNERQSQFTVKHAGTRSGSVGNKSFHEPAQSGHEFLLLTLAELAAAGVRRIDQVVRALLIREKSCVETVNTWRGE